MYYSFSANVLTRLVQLDSKQSILQRHGFHWRQCCCILLFYEIVALLKQRLKIIEHVSVRGTRAQSYTEACTMTNQQRIGAKSMEETVYKPSNVRPRLESNSSQYVSLREAPKLKPVAATSKSKDRYSKQRLKERKSLGEQNKHNDIKVPLTLMRSQEDKKTPKTSFCAGCSLHVCVHRVLQAFVVVFSIAALTIVTLMVFGVLVPYNCKPCRIQVSFQDAEQLKSENELPQLITENTFQLNLSPLQETVKDLEANLTALQAEAEALMKESQNNRDVLQSAKTEYNSTKESVKSFSDRFLSNLTQIHENFHQQFDPDHGPVFAELRDLNESKSNQLNELEQRLDQENEGIDMTMESVNNTITDKVVVKISQPGPIGERGLTGPKGLRGDAGPIGAQGLKGSTGPVGLKGLKGDPGIDGFPGSPGSRGIDGEKGLKGDKGERGATGNQGPRGLTGEKGIGNFSWCQWKEATDPSPGDQAKAQDSVDVKIIAASCTTDGAQEYNLQVTPITNGHEYKCACQSIGLCILNYWECPTQAP